MVFVGCLVTARILHPALRASVVTDVLAAVALPTEAAREDSAVVEDPEVREIIAQPTLRRRIAPIRFVGDRRTYEFLVMHPPLATQVAKRLHPPLERYTVAQVGDGVYTIDDRGALRGDARLIVATDDQRVYRFQGEFRSLAHLIRFTGRMVLILRYREVREGDRTFMDSDPDFYLRIDHPFFHVVTKLLAPLIGGLIDRRVNMIVEATRKLFDEVQRDPKGLYQQMATWPEVQLTELEAFRQAFLSKEAVTR